MWNGLIDGQWELLESEVMGQVLDPLAGPRDDRGVGGGWGGDHVALLLCGQPPGLVDFERLQHERTLFQMAFTL